MTSNANQAGAQPEISVIIPVFNVGKYIAECLESVLIQSFGDFEVIVVDDGSTDETPAIVDRYCKLDPRISSYSQDRQGAGVARNVGLSHARGEYLLFFDGDDIMLPDMLATLHARAAETNADITACRSTQFKNDDPTVITGEIHPGGEDTQPVMSGSDYGDQLYRLFAGWPWDKLIKADFIKAHALEYQPLTSTNDAYFVFVALALAKSIALVPDSLVCHRFHDTSIEATSHRTPHNAYIAYRATEERLLAEKVPDATMKSFHNWGLSHFRWAMTRFDGDREARSVVMGDYLELAKEFVAYPDDHFLYPVDLRVRNMLRDAEELSAEKALLLQAIDAEANDEETKALQAELEQCRATIADRDQHIAALENSTSFKLGRAMTAAPRKLRDTIAK